MPADLRLHAVPPLAIGGRIRTTLLESGIGTTAIVSVLAVGALLLLWAAVIRRR